MKEVRERNFKQIKIKVFTIEFTEIKKVELNIENEIFLYFITIL